jgi:two-component system, NtrC family, response regulator AtoC
MARSTLSVPDVLPNHLKTGIPGVHLYIGQSSDMQLVAQRIYQIAAADRTTAIIGGESGTGKELVARAIHTLSNRARHQFVPVNCSTIVPQLAESLLFGAERGAFTDSRQQRGYVEQAHMGTLFLDEVAELSMQVQTTLLRFLESREFRRLGGQQQIKADVRVLAASWRDLREAVREGAFRADLYYRLDVFQIMVPPLRERRADLPALIDECLCQCATALQIPTPPPFDDTAMELLCAYHWPGNIRQLRNCLERALILSNGRTILPEHLPASIHDLPEPASMPIPDLAEVIGTLQLPKKDICLPELVQQMEARLIYQAMAETQNNQSYAARRLGLTRDQLRQRLKRMRF